LFGEYSGGAKTNRDAWCFNPSLESLTSNVKGMMDVYNSERVRFHSTSTENVNLENFVIADPTRISWNRSLLRHLASDRKHQFDPMALRKSNYRPFTPQWLYFDRSMISDIGKMPKFFPRADTENRIIVLKLRWSGHGQIASMSDRVIELQSDGGTQCFPLYVFDEENAEREDLFAEESEPLTSRDGISDAGLKHFQDAYPGETITKEDLFYYVYGLLHSENYRAKYADNLSKELPRIPRVKTAADFWAFSSAGRELGDVHVNYETVEPYPVTIKQGDLRLADIKNPEAFYRVTKWAFGKAGKEKDKTTVIYNANITMTDVPLAAYDYVVNGKPALEWVMERQVVKVDKASGIENDANRYANETMGNPAYPLELFQRVITVSLRTMEIVRSLPKLEVL
jgi:predicted helicase